MGAIGLGKLKGFAEGGREYQYFFVEHVLQIRLKIAGLFPVGQYEQHMTVLQKIQSYRHGRIARSDKPP